jgi:hypothetical protein
MQLTWPVTRQLFVEDYDRLGHPRRERLGGRNLGLQDQGIKVGIAASLHCM